MHASSELGRAQSPPSGWLGQLVLCAACGHGIGDHATDRCLGRPQFRCPCRFGYSGVLERAERAASDECVAERTGPTGKRAYKRRAKRTRVRV